MKVAYFESLASLSTHAELNKHTPIKFVNTSMHGVSHPFVTKAFEVYGFASFIPVKEQQAPDPEFPTVSFPNPEEKGALVSTSVIHEAGYTEWLFRESCYSNCG
jgi:phosphomannomutase